MALIKKDHLLQTHGERELALRLRHRDRRGPTRPWDLELKVRLNILTGAPRIG